MIRRSVVALTLLLAAVASMLSACGAVGGGGGGLTVTAQFRDAAGLFTGNDVGVLGVRVGEVTRIDPRGSLVDVTLQIDPGVRIPADAGAVIVSRSVATDRYVELTPVYDSGPILADGTVIAIDSTRNPVEFDQLLASVDELAGAVAGPRGTRSALTDVVSVLSDVLDGNGQKIGSTVANLGTALESFNDGSGDVAAVLDNLDVLTSTLADNDRTVRTFADRLAEATDLLDDDKVLIGETFEALSVTLRKVAAFVRDHRVEIGSQLGDITAISTTLLDHQKQLTQLTETFPLLMQNVERAVGDDGRLTMHLRPADLVPGPEAIGALCDELQKGLCDDLDLTTLGLLELFDFAKGVTR